MAVVACGQQGGLLNQLVARCVLGLPVRRNEEVVPGSSGVTWQDLENDGLAYIGQPGTCHLLLVSSSLMGTQVTAGCMQCQSVRLPSVLGATSGVPACNIGLVCKICRSTELLLLALGLDWQSYLGTVRQLY